MRVSGPSADLAKLVASLDPQRFVELVADVLALRGHSRIKIVDGPGDGGRDIHSLDRKGARHLTQCKYHTGATKAVSSREMGDLPLGMSRLGYKQGLFATTGRVSPQSKREFLDNYPGLSLEFLEGVELGAEVLRDVLLRSIWFNGVALDRISYAVSVPVLLRDLSLDKPLSLSSLNGSFKMKRLRRSALPPIDLVDVRLHAAQLRSSDFAPYRPPSRKTATEGWWPTITAGELLLTRLERLEQIHSMLKAIARRILRRAASQWPNKVHLGLRFGKPSITPLEGQHAGSRIELGASPFTIVRHGDLVIDELDWLTPELGPVWFPPKRVSALTAEWVRWYNRENDICLDLNLIDVPSELARGIAAEHLEFARRQWNKSVFALLSKQAAGRLNELGIPLPTEQLSWYEDKLLCCWLIGSFSPLRPILIEPEDGAESHPSPFEPNPEDISEAIKELLDQLGSLGAEILNPERARHAYAFVAQDPLPTPDTVVYRSVDLLYHVNDIPSPIEPGARRIQFVACWLLSESQTDECYPEVQSAVDQLRADYEKNFSVKLVYDTETRSGTYAVLYIDFLPLVGMEPTECVLGSVLNQLRPLLEEMSGLLSRLVSSSRKATEHFWNNEIGLFFPNA